MSVTRILEFKDAEALREIRLYALRNDGRFFTADYEQESRRNLPEWGLVAQETIDQAIFGAFDDEYELVSIAGARKWYNDPSGLTVYWHSDYTMPEFRKTVLAARLYKMREDWCFIHGFRKAVFTIHHKNEKATSLHQRRNARAFDKENLRFADGNADLAIWYQRDIAA